MKADHFTLSHSILSTWYAPRIASNLHPIQRGQTRCDAYQAKMSGNTIVRLFSMTKCLVAPWLQHPPLCIFPSEDLDLCLVFSHGSHVPFRRICQTKNIVIVNSYGGTIPEDWSRFMWDSETVLKSLRFQLEHPQHSYHWSRLGPRFWNAFKSIALERAWSSRSSSPSKAIHHHHHHHHHHHNHHHHHYVKVQRADPAVSLCSVKGYIPVA